MSIKKMMYGLLSFLIVISFLSAVGSFAVLNQNQDNGKVVNYSGTVRGGTQRLVKLYLMQQDIGEQIERIQTIISALNNGDAALGIPKPTNDDFILKMKKVESYWKDILLPCLSKDPTQVDMDTLLTQSETFFSIADESVQSAEVFTENGIRLLKVMSVATFFLILLCILVIASIIRNKVINPIKEIEFGMINFSEGNLSAEISYHSNNELGRLAESIRMSMSTLHGYIEEIDQVMYKMSSGNFDIVTNLAFIGDFKGIEASIATFLTTISETFHQLNMVSDQVFASSAHVSTAAQSLAQGSTEQAATVQELSTTISDVSHHVNQNAEHSIQASHLANTAMAAVSTSDVHMQALVSTMEQMDGKSSEIGKIIKTIEDIAFQTNILALNAAVEAARAGTAGKGFAVVADEVRNLASKSAEAAQNTAVLIEGSLASIREGVAVARKTAGDLAQIRADTQSTQDMVERISSASEVQAKTLTTIAEGVKQITDVIHANSATSEESAASSQALTSQANLMKSFLARFQFKSV